MKPEVNINITDIIYELQQIDSSLLLKIMGPTIIYYVTDKAVNTYKLNKKFKAKNTYTIDLPPEVIKKHSEIDKEGLLKQKFGDSIVNFATTIIKKIPSANLNLFYKNLSDLITITEDKKSPNEGSYIIKDNTIKVKENNYLLTIDHELFHMASSFYRESDARTFSGFKQATKNEGSIGQGINEGYTQLLAERYFGTDKIILEVYPIEKHLAELLQIIIGKEKMESLYLTADLYGLIQELKQFETETNIMEFFNSVDFCNNYIHKKKLTMIAKNMLIQKLKTSEQFLLKCYMRKLAIEATCNEFDEEKIKNKFTLFLNELTKKLKIGRITFNVTKEKEIDKIINTALDGFEAKINTPKQENSQFESRRK